MKSVHFSVAFPEASTTAEVSLFLGYGFLGAQKLYLLTIARWWFQTFVIFTPDWGNDPI